MKCGFIGHRDCVGIERKVNEAIKKIIEMGNVEFLSGGMGNFDKTCEKAVKAYGGKLTFIPYNEKVIKATDRMWYDEIFCPFGKKEYSKYDIPNRNKWLVDNCDVFICYVNKMGGAWHTLEYAKEKNKLIINI